MAYRQFCMGGHVLDHYYLSDQVTHFVRSRDVECGFVESRFIELVTSAFLIGKRSFTHSTSWSPAQAGR